MSPSKKTSVIEAIFNSRWNPRTKSLSDPQVTLEVVEEAIRLHNSQHPDQKLSTRNPANFFKDFIRKKSSANSYWPKSVLSHGYTARQVTGKNLCFEFMPLARGQTAAFPVSSYAPTRVTQTHSIQSSSMSLASRRLGRSDEAWLIQVLVKLNVIETHLSVASKREIVQVDLLQTNLKQSRAEIDALFLAVERNGGEGNGTREVLVTCEAKGIRDDILEDQIIAQVKAVFKMRAITQSTVIPLAAKAVGPSKVYIVQFAPVFQSQVSDLESLILESEALYELVPAVPGIGE